MNYSFDFNLQKLEMFKSYYLHFLLAAKNIFPQFLVYITISFRFTHEKLRYETLLTMEKELTKEG